MIPNHKNKVSICFIPFSPTDSVWRGLQTQHQGGLRGPLQVTSLRSWQMASHAGRTSCCQAGEYHLMLTLQVEVVRPAQLPRETQRTQPADLEMRERWEEVWEEEAN